MSTGARLQKEKKARVCLQKEQKARVCLQKERL